MFTGIVDHCGTITKIEKGEGGRSLILGIDTQFSDLVTGESVSVDGACLTAVNIRPGHFDFAVSSETLTLTSAREYAVGGKVNLERALRLGDRFGGHWVTGHIDGTGRVKEITKETDFIKVSFCDVPSQHRPLLLPKGSVAVQGVSLTINGVDNEGFHVMLIPHTLERTNLSTLRPGSPVNLEFDWMVKVVLNEAQRLKLIGERT